MTNTYEYKLVYPITVDESGYLVDGNGHHLRIRSPWIEDAWIDEPHAIALADEIADQLNKSQYTR